MLTNSKNTQNEHALYKLRSNSDKDPKKNQPPNEIRDDEITKDNEEEVVLRKKNKSIDKALYVQLHAIPSIGKKRLSLQSLDKYKLLFSNPNSAVNNTIIKSDDKILNNDEDVDEETTITVVRRSESIDTVLEIERELSNFVMDKKKDKKPNKIKKIFSFNFFKNKKTKEDHSVVVPNDSYQENYKNENNSFKRNVPQRHTVGCEYIRTKNSHDHIRNQPSYKSFPEDNPHIVQQYAEMHINKFNKIRTSFENQDTKHLNESVKTNPSFLHNGQKMHNESCPRSAQGDHYFFKQSPSSSKNDETDSTSHNTYENALIVQAELKKIKLEETKMQKLSRNASFRRDTPPRAEETNPKVNIVRPKARLPLPENTAEQDKKKPDVTDENNFNNTISTQFESNQKTQLNEIYGTVFDNIDNKKNQEIKKHLDHSNSDTINRSSPATMRTSPIDQTKLKLPPKREIVVLQPRLKSPIPHNINEDRVIATELLRSPEKCNLPKESRKNIENSDTVIKNNSVTEALESLRSKIEQTDNNLKEKLEQIKNTLQDLRMSPNITQTLSVGENSIDLSRNSKSVGEKLNSPCLEFNSMPKRPERLSLISQTNTISPNSLRDSFSTPEVELRQKIRSNSRSPMPSPKKEDIRKSVEAYYWKEIKKIKEREDEIYMSQMQLYPIDNRLVIPYDPRYVQAPNYNSRKPRSSSIPRNVIRNLGFNSQDVQKHNDSDEIYGIGPKRNVHTLKQKNMESLPPIPQKKDIYKPIFRRGSLTRTATPTPDMSNQLNKKVSFSSPNRRGDLELQKQQSSQIITTPDQIYTERRAPRVNYNSDVEMYGYTKPPAGRSRMEIHQQMELRKPPNYASDSEAIYGTRSMRSYKKMSLEEMERLRQMNMENSLHRTGMPRPQYALTRHESISFPRTPNTYMGIRHSSQQFASPNEIRYSSPNINQSMIYSGMTPNGQNASYYNVYSNTPRIIRPQSFQNINRSRQVMVRNQVCDIYGKIHDSDKSSIQETGVVMGQVINPPNFQRNSRLTSSVNDIYSSRQCNAPGSMYGDTRVGHQIEQSNNDNIRVRVNVSSNKCDNNVYISNIKQ